MRKNIDSRKLVAPAVITAITIWLMGGAAALMVWAYKMDPAEAPPLLLLLPLVALPLVVIPGVIGALAQRIREIKKGEIDDAKKY